MKFIREMIKKKSQPSSLSEEIGADLQGLRAKHGGDAAENVPDFTDLVSEFKPENAEEQLAESDQEILAIFDENDDDTTWEDLQEEDENEVADEYHDDDDEDDEYTNKHFSAPDHDEPAQDVVVPISTAAELPSPEYLEPELDEPSIETVETPAENVPQPQVQAKKIWDLPDDDFDEDVDTGFIPEDEPALPEPTVVEVPAPAAGRAGRRAGRVKTRLLGFEQSQGAGVDLFDPSQIAGKPADAKFPVGWIVILDGPGRGSSFSLFNGVSQIGRGEDQIVRLDFGDNSISRSNHAAVAYDGEQCAFFLGHGGKANLVRLNDKPVLSTEELADNDLIRIGETTLKFVALCGAEFDWERDAQEDGDDAAIA